MINFEVAGKAVIPENKRINQDRLYNQMGNNKYLNFFRDDYLETITQINNYSAFFVRGPSVLIKVYF